jgi:hypothetical protein
MLKKLIIFLVIAVVAVPAFSQAGRRQMAANVNLNPLVASVFLSGWGIEGGLEYAVIRPISVKANALYATTNPLKAAGGLDNLGVDFGGVGVDASISVSALRFSLEGRWYPAQNYLEGFFVGGGLQFHRLMASGSLSISYEGESERFDATEGMNTFGVFAGLGYKAVFGKSRVAFTLEPVLDFAWPIMSDIPFKDMNDGLGSDMAGNVAGWALGVLGPRFRLLFGLAF